MNSDKILTKLYSKDYSFTKNDGTQIEIPKTGTLGLLAYGYIGVIAVRKARNEKRIQKYIKNKSK